MEYLSWIGREKRPYRLKFCPAYHNVANLLINNRINNP
jgi:hypothetical protein